MSKDTSKAFVKSNVDKIMNEILLHALHNHPERFAHVLEDRPMEFFPPIHSSNFNGTGTSDQASGGERKQLLTGISAWDSARASSNGNWWSALSADSGPQNQECVTTQGIQTEGRISHYPAGSKWLNSTSVTSEESVKHIISPMNDPLRRVGRKTGDSLSISSSKSSRSRK
mmetsp:Transcript_22115/g.37448  ORF Transcript_22115/g.37448 Transcript_22115/m.37448 type:complete len:171 (-) Transcript_22115:163-675(-)